MDGLQTEQMSEAEFKAAQRRRDAFKRELQERGELPKDTSVEELKKSEKKWQQSI